MRQLIMAILALFLLGLLGCATLLTATEHTGYVGSKDNQVATASTKVEGGTLTTKLAVDPGAVVPYGVEVIERGVDSVRDAVKP